VSSHDESELELHPVNYEVVGRIYTNIMIRLFGSPRHLYPSPRSAWQAYLPAYVARALRTFELDITVLIGALTLLFRYKEARPDNVAFDDDAYKLFLSTYVVAHNVMCNESRSLAFWRRVGQEIFPCEEITSMEGELCRVLGGNVQIDDELYAWFDHVLVSGGMRLGDAEEDWVSFEEVEEPVVLEEYAMPPPIYQDVWKDTKVLEIRVPAYPPPAIDDNDCPVYGPVFDEDGWYAQVSEDGLRASDERVRRRMPRRAKQSFREKALGLFTRAFLSTSRSIPPY